MPGAASDPAAEPATPGVTPPDGADVAGGAAAEPPEEASPAAEAAGTDPTSVPSSTTPTPGPAAAGPASLRTERVQLVSESGKSLTVGVRTVLGKHTVRQLGEDFNVWDTEQFALERAADGTWQIVPHEGTTNETMVNGETVTAPRPLQEGDVIAVGRAAKGIVRLPLTVRPA